MTTRYQKEHYEDVARILRYYRPTQRHSVLGKRSQGEFVAIAKDFAALFAADNPPACIDCGFRRGDKPDPEGAEGWDACTGHLFEGGFDREQFLAACGLES